MSRIVISGAFLMMLQVFAAPSSAHALAPAGSRAADDAFLITPGVGIGKVKIGMPIASVISVLGAPKQVWRGRGGGGIDMYAWFKVPDRCAGPSAGGGLLVYVDPVGMVTRVTAYNDPRYFLENGLHVGSDASMIQARMGGAGRMGGIGLMICDHLVRNSSSIQYPALGITFHDSGTGAASISVYAPDTK
jgi:hypothetical protein